MHPLDSTIVLILRKSVHTPDNSIVLILQKKQAAARAYMALNRDYMCAQKRAKYVLAEPKPDVKDMYVKDFQRQLLPDAEAFIEFITNSFYVQMAHPTPLINTIIACFLNYLAV